MYREIRDELSHWAEQRRHRDSLRTQQTALELHLVAQEAHLVEAKGALAKEREDVERLENLTFKKLYTRFAGKHPEQLGKEQTEAYMAELHYLELQELVSGVQIELASVREQLEGLASVDQEYDAAFRRKAAALVEGGDAAGKAISDLIDSIANGKAWEREFAQATQAGNHVVQLLDHALGYQRRAELVGTRHFVHGNLAQAAQALATANAALVRFQAEMRDIQENFVILGALDTRVHVEDFQFPILNAWLIQRHQQPIRVVRQQVANALEHVQQRHAALQTHLRQVWATYEKAVNEA